MKLFDLENRLVATDDDGEACAVWTGAKWQTGSSALAGKAWASGETLSPSEASRRFPDAQQRDIPDLSIAE
jgi:hypothetical protein